MRRKLDAPASGLSRRAILAAGAATLVSTPMRAAPVGLRAIAFDAFPLFDPRSIAARVRALIPVEGDKLAAAWSSKLFADTWLATAADHYLPFDVLADAALRSAADGLKLPLTDAARRELLDCYGELGVWPDVALALETLKRSGQRLAVLSNLGEATLRRNLDRAGISPFFEAVLSTDRVRRFKPAAAAYGMGTEALNLPKSAIGFAAFGGWDAVGATWFGYRTAWINRGNAPTEALDIGPEIVTNGMEGVLKLAGLS